MIYIAGDKHGYKAIKIIEDYLRFNKIDFQNLGVSSEGEDIKLEDMIPNVVDKIKEDEKNKGILTCGTGIGVEVGANKFSGIRACLATNEQVAEWSRVYDKCNVLCLIGWGVEKEKVYKMLDKWFSAEYDGSEKRLKMFEEFNKWH
jgi:ribose 5-phosphate isomerase B